MPAAPAEISLFIFGTNCPVCQVWHLLLPDRIGRYLALANITFLATTPPSYCPPQLFSATVLRNILLHFLFCIYMTYIFHFSVFTCQFFHDYFSLFTCRFHFPIFTLFFFTFTFQLLSPTMNFGVVERIHSPLQKDEIQY